MKILTKIVLVIIYLSPLTGYSLSFDCKKNDNYAQKEICGSDSLSKLDTEMITLFVQARKYIFDQRTLLSEQDEFINKRNLCSNEKCIKNIYLDRMESLNQTVTFYKNNPMNHAAVTTGAAYPPEESNNKNIYKPKINIAKYCVNIKDGYDQAYCYNKFYAKVDQELNNDYEILAKQLSTPQKKTLKKLQLKWIEERNSECSYKNEGMFYINMKCAVDKTYSQSEFLSEQIELCKMGQCSIQSDDEKQELIQEGKYKVTYYNNKNIIASELVAHISINYSNSSFRGIPAENFRATWEVDVKSDVDGKNLVLYTNVLSLNLNVYMDDEIVTWPVNTSKGFPLTLSKGTHRIKLEYNSTASSVNFMASIEDYTKVSMPEAASNISKLMTSKIKTVYVGAYETENIYRQIVVTIKNNNSPIILFLSSYDAVNWVIDNPTNSSIVGIFFNSNNPGSSVDFSDGKGKIYQLIGLSNSYKGFEEPSIQIRQLTGMVPAYKYGEYRLTHVEVPSL